MPSWPPVADSPPPAYWRRAAAYLLSGRKQKPSPLPVNKASPSSSAPQIQPTMGTERQAPSMPCFSAGPAMVEGSRHQELFENLVFPRLFHTDPAARDDVRS